MMTTPFRALAIAATLFASAQAFAAGQVAQPEAHALAKARTPGSPKSAAQPLQPPTETVMSATRSADGSISLQCVEARNPAFEGSRRIAAPATQER